MGHWDHEIQPSFRQSEISANFRKPCSEPKYWIQSKRRETNRMRKMTRKGQKEGGRQLSRANRMKRQ